MSITQSATGLLVLAQLVLAASADPAGTWITSDGEALIRVERTHDASDAAFKRLAAAANAARAAP